MTEFVNLYTVNPEGLQQIAEFMKEKHKDGKAISENKAVLQKIGLDLELRLSKGEDACVEIDPSESLSGRLEELFVTEEGITIDEVDDRGR